MPDLKHITLTGIDDKTDIKELVRLQKQYPLVEFGVLLSWSRQGSERRYPSFQTIKAFNEVNLDHPDCPYKSTLEYVSQPDPDGNLCLRCKEIFVNRMQRYGL